MTVPKNQNQGFDDCRPYEDVKPQRQQSPPVEPHTRPGAGGSPAYSTLRPHCNVGHLCVSSRLRSVIADTLRLRNGESGPAPTIKCVSSTEVPPQEVRQRSDAAPPRRAWIRSAPVELPCQDRVLRSLVAADGKEPDAVRRRQTCRRGSSRLRRRAATEQRPLLAQLKLMAIYVDCARRADPRRRRIIQPGT
jgi:hypothetical protein